MTYYLFVCFQESIVKEELTMSSLSHTDVAHNIKEDLKRKRNQYNFLYQASFLIPETLDHTITEKVNDMVASNVE